MPPPTPFSSWRIGWGMVGSALLHGAVVLLLLLLADLLPVEMPLEPAPAFPVELITVGEAAQQGVPQVSAKTPEIKPHPHPPPRPPAKRAEPIAAPSDRKPEQGDTPFDVTAGARVGAGTGSFSVKDYIRAQIENHWNGDASLLHASDMLVTLHLSFDANGVVSQADIVEDRRFAGMANYQSVADSIRRAAIASSPLQLPEGISEDMRDITLTFNPREAVR